MLTPGTKIGGFLIGDLLGKGAMGEVYKGEQLSLKRPVAIKRIAGHLLENEDMVRRFKREAQVLAKVSHPNVVGVIECEEFPGPDGAHHLLLIMELIEGGRSLKSHLGKPVDWRLATSVVRMAADGLAAAFEQQVVHRDIKPDNIMMTRKGIAKLVDFGLAKAAESTALTMQAAPMGTPLFMSPEACRGEEVGHAGDLYSLGVSWFYMLTGKYPFEASNLHGLLFKHISDPPPPPTGLFDHVPKPIVDLVYQCLEKDPAKRPASAVRLVEAIESLPAQGILLPRDARELIAGGLDATHAGGGSTTAGTLVAGKAGATAATILQGATPAQAATVVADMSPRGAAGATVSGDLSPHGAVAQTVVSDLSGGANPRPVGASTVPTAVPPAAPAATAPETATPSAGKSAGLVIAVLVVLLAGLGFVGWKLFGGSAPAKPDQPGGTIAAQVPAKPDPATGTMTGDPQRTATPAKPSDAPIGNDPAKPVGTDPAKDPKTGTTVVAALPVDLPKPVDEPKPVPPKPVDEPKPVPPKPVDEPKPVPPKPVDEPKPEPKPVDQPKPEPPKAIDTSAFDKALAAREWANAKAEADALPDPARADAKAKLTKAANSQLIATMRAAKPVYDQQRYAECAAMLGKEAATMDCADPDTRSKFIALVKAVRQAAKDAQENP